MRFNTAFTVKTAMYILFFVIFVIFQTNIFDELKIFAIKPNLVLIYVVTIAIFENEKFSSIIGFVFGFLMDAVYGSPFKFSGILYFGFAYMTSVVCRIYFKKTILSMLIFTSGAAFMRLVFNLFFLMGVWSDFNLYRAVVYYLFPELLYTVMVSPVIYFMIKYTAGRINYKRYNL